MTYIRLDDALVTLLVQMSGQKTDSIAIRCLVGTIPGVHVSIHMSTIITLVNADFINMPLGTLIGRWRLVEHCKFNRAQFFNMLFEDTIGKVVQDTLKELDTLVSV